MHPSRLFEKDAQLFRDRLVLAEDMLEDAGTGAVRVNPLRHLGELERVTEQDESPGRGAASDRVSKAVLAGLVDDERVELAVELLAREQPGCARYKRDLRIEHSWRIDGLEFPLIEADAERVPCRAEVFDLAISEYGACLWADPDRWVAEAARILRPGGELIFLVNSVLFALCVPAENGVAGERLLRPAFGMRRIEWPGDPGVEFHLSHGDWIRVLRHNGFEIEDLIEVRPPASATTSYDYVTLEWARQWPSEEIWRARRR